MPNSRKILIVDDDNDLRDSLVEQIALHDEFRSEERRVGKECRL